MMWVDHITSAVPSPQKPTNKRQADEYLPQSGTFTTEQLVKLVVTQAAAKKKKQEVEEKKRSKAGEKKECSRKNAAGRMQLKVE